MQESAYIKNVKLDNVQDGIEFIEHLINGYMDRMVSETDLRATVYALKQLLDYIKHRDNAELLARLEALEEQIGIGK